MIRDQDFIAFEAERAIIGGLLLNNRLFDLVGDSLRPEHFQLDSHRAIFAELASQLAAGKGCDPITVATAMGDRVTLAELAELAQYVPSSSNVRRHAELLIERAKSRALHEASSQVAELAADHAQSIDTRVEQAQALLAGLLTDAPRDDWIGAYEGMLEHTELLERRQRGEITAWPTGLESLDDVLEGGLRPGELVIVGARPSMGKTALGLTIAVHMAGIRPVAVLSMEMSHAEVRDRLTAMLGQVTMSAVKRPANGNGLAWDRVVEGVERAKLLQLRISDQGGLNINQVRSKARNAKRMGGLEVLVVDYIGLMAGLDPKANRNAQLGEISRGLKTLAKELQICVLCLAQLNRKAEERADAMPQMSDLRDSGEIEQDADVILFIKRPIMANPELGPEWQHYARLAVAKNRQGRTGVYLDLTYVGEQTRFTAWSGPAPQKRLDSKRGGGL
jgi:replicative DNA helicase